MKDFSGIAIEKLSVDLTDQDVKEALDKLHKNYKGLKPHQIVMLYKKMIVWHVNSQ